MIIEIGPTEAIADETCYCQYVTFKPCPYCARVTGAKIAWDKMNTDEKSKAVAYRRIIRNGKEPSNPMLSFINLLYQRYEDFDLSAIP